jgi:anti-sigma28 factor (negative regulator of flagellin synthesis)
VSGSEEFHRIEGRSSRVLADRAMTLPEIRLGKVDALRRRLAAGTYVVDASQVARAIVEFELEWKR